MDFGIALAVSAAAGGRMTETGLSLGTPHYMSPEQATAEKDISPRADEYSLATVLYEMLTGNPPHVGASAQQIIMKIITETAPPVTVYRKTVPPNVAAALARALEKLPADRFESAKAFRDALGSEGYAYATTAAGAATAIGGATSTGRGGSRRATLIAAAVAVIAIGAAVAGWMRGTPEPPFRRMDLALGIIKPDDGSDVVISPNGTMLALTAVGAIFLRHLDGEADFRKLADTEGASFPSFSPDNEWIVFRRASDKTLVKVSVNGGGATTLLSGGKFDPYMPMWGADGNVVFTGPTGAGIVSAAGGEPRRLQNADGRFPYLLPDGSGFLHTRGNNLALYDLKADSSITLVPGGRYAEYLPTGHLVYVALDGGLYTVPFDHKSKRVTGSPLRVLERVGASSSLKGYSVSANGVLVQYDADGNLAESRGLLLIVDPGHGADTVRLPLGFRRFPRFSSDGRKLALEAVTADGSRSDIYTLELATSTYSQLTFEGDNDEPAWSPDGKRVAFDKLGEKGEDLFIKPADNSGLERRVTTMQSSDIDMQQWIDDKTLLFSAVVPGRGFDVFTVSVDPGSQPVAVLQSPFNETDPHLSADRRMLAYTSDEMGGATQVWMRDYPSAQGKWNLSRGEGSAPRWAPDGKSVYFWRSAEPLDTLMRVRIDRTPTVVVHEPEVVAFLNAGGVNNWDLHPDGRRFVVAVTPERSNAAGGAAPRYLILQNWFGQLRRRMAAKSP